MEINKDLIELAKLKEIVASLPSKEIKAVTNNDDLIGEINYLHARVNAVYNYASSVESTLHNKMAKHMDNHLPPLKASAMEKILKTCGMEGDYNVQKPNIYCSASNKKGEITLDFSEFAKNQSK